MKEQLRHLISTPALQPFWSGLQKLCHAGMNYGGGQSVYGSGEIQVLKRLNRTRNGTHPLTVFDVGANSGEYLSVALDTLGEKVRVFSFEPQASSFQHLNEQFGSDARVFCHNLALGKQPGQVELFYTEGNATTASLHERIFGGDAQVAREAIEVTTLDQFCQQQQVDQIDLLKIDTEGHEVEVLLGARNLLDSGNLRWIQFEFGETFVQSGYYFRDVYELLGENYRMFRILRRGLAPISGYSHDLETFKCANFLCIHKSMRRQNDSR